VAEVHVARDLADAVAVLDAQRGAAIPVAGGTDLVLDRRLGRVDAECLVDLSRLDELRGVAWADDVVTIGAMTRIRVLELDRDLAERTSAITDAARVLGSVQVRTMATLGGNLAHATPSAEMVPALLVHGAEVDVTGPSGARSMALRDLFVAPGRTTLSSAELLTHVRARATPTSGSCYLRQTVRWAMDLAGVGVAAMVEVQAGAITAARVALGAVAPVPLVVPEAAAVVVGAPFSAQRADRAGELASEASRPISDARGPAEYRRAVVRVLVARALHLAWRRATGAWHGPVPQHGVVGMDATDSKGSRREG
jgi:CO/xanthine dehydrogenase FAD-binding subunit